MNIAMYHQLYGFITSTPNFDPQDDEIISSSANNNDIKERFAASLLNKVAASDKPEELSSSLLASNIEKYSGVNKTTIKNNSKHEGDTNNDAEDRLCCDTLLCRNHIRPKKLTIIDGGCL